jgi:hypothetical protein
MANVYGNNGNRWWVGLNVGSDQSTVFGTGSILSPNGYESLPSGNAGDDRQFAAAAKHNATASKPNTISVEHVDWFNIRGPFSTQAAANAALPAIAKANPAPGEIQQLTGGGQSNAANGGGFNPTSWEQAITGFFGALTDANTWVRVLKIVVGGGLMLIAVSKMTGAGSVISKIPVPIPL